MRPIVVVFIGVALLVAGLAAFLAKVYLTQQGAPQAVEEAAAPQKPRGLVQILVAAHDIAPGTVLAETDMRWADWPEAAINEHYIVNKDDNAGTAAQAAAASGLAVEGAAAPDAQDNKAATLQQDAGQQTSPQAVQTEPPSRQPAGSIARRAILAGEPIAIDSFVRPGDRGVAAAIVNPGMRAISVPISTESAAAGFIVPGDHVDVVLTSNIRQAMADQLEQGQKSNVLVSYAAETILRDVRVLAIDQKLARAAEDGPAVIGKTAMLEVTPKDAEKLEAASMLGKLSLILRSMIKVAQPASDAGDAPGDFTADLETSRALARMNGKAGTGNRVRVNRGGQITEQSF